MLLLFGYDLYSLLHYQLLHESGCSATSLFDHMKTTYFDRCFLLTSCHRLVLFSTLQVEIYILYWVIVKVCFCEGRNSVELKWNTSQPSASLEMLVQYFVLKSSYLSKTNYTSFAWFKFLFDLIFEFIHHGHYYWIFGWSGWWPGIYRRTCTSCMPHFVLHVWQKLSTFVWFFKVDLDLEICISLLIHCMQLGLVTTYMTSLRCDVWHLLNCSVSFTLLSLDYFGTTMV